MGDDRDGWPAAPTRARDASIPAESAPLCAHVRILVAAAIVCGLAHAAAALGSMAFAPWGFPALHARTAANVVLPAVLALASGAAVAGLVRRPSAWMAPAAALWAALWCGGAIAALALYTQSAARIALACALPCGAMFLLAVAVASVRALRPANPRRLAAFSALGLLVGAAFPFTQRAGAPATRPGGPIPAAPLEGPRVGDASVLVAPGVRLFDDGTVILDRVRPGSPAARIEPRLRFESRAPQGGWTLFAPRALRAEPEDRDLALFGGPGRASASGTGLGRWRVEARALDHRRIEIDAETTLDRDESSHLNAWFEVRLSSAAGLRLRLDPRAGSPLEFRRWGGFLRRPAQFASLHDDGTLRVHEAARAEKGPFREIARGALARGEPLVLTIERHARPWMRVTLLDFASQASTDPSPTAGWGIPQNAIEWGGGGGAWISASLAGTSIGRGFDTVGHAAGTYRSRVIVETFGD